MKLFKRLLYINENNSVALFFAIVVAFLISCEVNQKLSEIFMTWTSVDTINLIHQFIILFFSTVLLSIIIVLIFTTTKKFLPNLFKQIKRPIVFVNDCLQRDPNRGVLIAMLLLAMGVGSIFFVNTTIHNIDTITWEYSPSVIIPVEFPVGLDFRVGSYRPALNLVTSNFSQISPDGSYASIYPPLVALLNLPYLLFDENTAYLWHIAVLYLANITCLGLVTLMVKDFLFSKLNLEKGFINFISLFLFVILLFYTLSSYPFLFSIERGQTDILPLLFSLLSLWVFLKKPDQIWLQVIFLSIATHMKIYPAALFLILLVKHGKKIILPILVVNFSFLIILGPKMAWDFIQSLTSGSGIGTGIGNRWTWVGNHSAYSFSDYLAQRSSNHRLNLFILWPMLTLLVVELWFTSIYRLLRKHSPQNALLYFMVTIPLMDLFPTVSMDYKLVIINSAALILIALVLIRIIHFPSWFDLFQIIVILFILFFLGRAYAMSDVSRYDLHANASIFINNKFLWSLALEAIMAWNIFSFRENTGVVAAVMKSSDSNII